MARVWIRQLSAEQWQNFYQELHGLLTAGLPLIQALQLLTDHGVDRQQRELSWHLSQALLRGLSFSVAARLSQRFAELDLNLFIVGENSGQLPTILELLAQRYERYHRLRADLAKALSYPCLVLLLSLGVLSLMLVWVVPQFQQLFSSVGAHLPWLTRWVMDLSHTTLHGMAWFSGLWALVLIALGLLKWRRQDWLEQILQHVPMIGAIWRLSVWQRLCQSLGLMLQAGLPLLAALPIAAATAKSELAELALFMVGRDIQQGLPLYQAFQRQAFFPKVLSFALALAENTGRLDQALLQQSAYFERQLVTKLNRLARWLEPLLLVGVGAIVGIIVIAMYLPIFELGKMV